MSDEMQGGHEARVLVVPAPRQGQGRIAWRLSDEVSGHGDPTDLRGAERWVRALCARHGSETHWVEVWSRSSPGIEWEMVEGDRDGAWWRRVEVSGG